MSPDRGQTILGNSGLPTLTCHYPARELPLRLKASTSVRGEKSAFSLAVRRVGRPLDVVDCKAARLYALVDYAGVKDRALRGDEGHPSLSLLRRRLETRH